MTDAEREKMCVYPCPYPYPYPYPYPASHPKQVAIRLSHSYQQGHLIEINAHSLFSKWCGVARGVAGGELGAELGEEAVARRGGEEAATRAARPTTHTTPTPYPSRHAPLVRFSESGKMVLGMFAKIKDRTSVVSHASPSWASLATLTAALRVG